MKKSNLRNLIHEAILEVLEEDMAADNAAKTAELNALKLKQVALAKKAAELSKSNLGEDMAADNAAKTAELNALKLKQVALAKKKAELSKSNLGEMARTPLLFKVADDYDEAMLKALPKQSDKIMLWYKGIIDDVKANGESDTTTTAKRKFNLPQPRIAEYWRDLIKAGILVSTAGKKQQFQRMADDEMDDNTPVGAEDFFVGKKVINKPVTPDSDELDSEIEPEPEDVQKANKKVSTISDEDYQAFMLAGDLKNRISAIKSDILKNKKLSRGHDDLSGKPTTEVQRLLDLKAKLEKRLADLIASSKYLQKREPGYVEDEEDVIGKADVPEPEELDEWTISKLNYSSMKKVLCSILLMTFVSVAATAQEKTTVVKDEKTTKKTSSVPQKVHNTFSKDKKYNGKKTKHVKTVVKTTPAQ